MALSGWPNGGPPTSRKAKNKLLRDLLPSSNEPICKSYADFTRFLLGYTKEHPEYPNPPTNDQIIRLRPLTKDSILNNQTVFTTYTSVNHPNPEDWTPFKALLLADLAHHEIGGEFTFEWDAEHGENSWWNKVMIIFVVKHWTFAKTASAFSKYALEVKSSQPHIHVGIVTRWLTGRIEEIKNDFRSPQKVQQRERTRKRRELYEYRKRTVQLYLKQFDNLLPSADCCSDTEINPDQAVQRSIRPEWRSEKYGDWLHQVDRLSFKHQSTVMGRPSATRRFDTHRQAGNTMNPLAKVCRTLPVNCYSSVFLDPYDELQQQGLGITCNSSHLDEAVKAVAELLL